MALKRSIDTPTNTFATLNPLNSANPSALSEGNLKYISNITNNWKPSLGSLGITSGKWYWEGRFTGSVKATLFGFADSNFTPFANNVDTAPDSQTGLTYVYSYINAGIFYSSAFSGTESVTSTIIGDVLAMFLDI